MSSHAVSHVANAVRVADKIIQDGDKAKVMNYKNVQRINQALRLLGFCCSGSVTLVKKKGESKQKIVNISGFSGP